MSDEEIDLSEEAVELTTKKAVSITLLQQEKAELQTALNNANKTIESLREAQQPIAQKPVQSTKRKFFIGE
jgi:hypothetical protein